MLLRRLQAAGLRPLQSAGDTAGNVGGVETLWHCA